MTETYTVCPRCGFGAMTGLGSRPVDGLCLACGWSPIAIYKGIYRQHVDGHNYTGLLTGMPPENALAALDPAAGDYCAVWNEELGVIEYLVGEKPKGYVK